MYSPCFRLFSAVSVHIKRSLLGRNTLLQNTAWHPSRYTNAWIVDPTLVISNARAEVESPQTRPLNSTGYGANTHMITILVVILLLVALGALPTWPYSSGWGYYPSGGLGLVVLVLVILLLLGRI
jgi:hypothetical protein